MGGIRIRIPLLVAALLFVPLLPAASASHVGCDPATTTPTATHETGAGETLYTHNAGSNVWVFREGNGIPGLQMQGGCGHRADAQLMHACGRLDTRIPGTILCLVETA